MRMAIISVLLHFLAFIGFLILAFFVDSGVEIGTCCFIAGVSFAGFMIRLEELI